MMSECYDCVHKEAIAGNAHIKCNNPDHSMTGNAHGIKHRWFFYPTLFDPTWKTKLCKNFKPKSDNAISDAISNTVSQENGQVRL